MTAMQHQYTHLTRQRWFPKKETRFWSCVLKNFGTERVFCLVFPTRTHGLSMSNRTVVRLLETTECSTLRLLCFSVPRRHSVRQWQFTVQHNALPQLCRLVVGSGATQNQQKTVFKVQLWSSPLTGLELFQSGLKAAAFFKNLTVESAGPVTLVRQTARHHVLPVLQRVEPSCFTTWQVRFTKTTKRRSKASFRQPLFVKQLLWLDSTVFGPDNDKFLTAFFPTGNFLEQPFLCFSPKLPLEFRTFARLLIPLKTGLQQRFVLIAFLEYHCFGGYGWPLSAEIFFSEAFSELLTLFFWKFGKNWP